MRKYILNGGIMLALVVAPAVVSGQSAPPAAGCAGAVEPVTKALGETAQRATAIAGEIAVIEIKLEDYYQRVAVPAGMTVPNMAALEVETDQARQAAETEINQLPSLQLRCTPNPGASVARLNKEVGEALAAVRGYRTAVRTELLTIRTKAIQATSPKPAADDRTEP